MGIVNDLSMFCGYRILIQNDPYIIIYKISQIVYFKYSILTNHGHINFTENLIS